MSNVISLKMVRELRHVQTGDPAYHAKLLVMDKLELLEEMMRFQEERSALKELNLSLMVRGQILFKILEKQAETQELKDLAKSYSKHLKLEMDQYFSNQPKVDEK